MQLHLHAHIPKSTITHVNTTIVGVLPRKLDGTLIGLGTTIAEEDLVGTAIIGKPRGKLSLLGVEVKVGYVMELLHLVGNCLGQFLIVVSQGACGNTADKVQIFLAVGTVSVASISGN